MVIQVVMVDDGRPQGSTQGDRNSPKDRTLRDTTEEFDKIGLCVVKRHCLEPVIQIGLEPGKGSTVNSKCVL